MREACLVLAEVPGLSRHMVAGGQCREGRRGLRAQAWPREEAQAVVEDREQMIERPRKKRDGPGCTSRGGGCAARSLMPAGCPVALGLRGVACFQTHFCPPGSVTSDLSPS